jgi:hypothetical protein|nr:hypothetical protein [Kofleriaceae bacterium]
MTARLASLWVMSLSLALGCSVTHRSGEFACDPEGNCTGGRICEDGFCVVPGATDDAGVDAPHHGSGSGSGSAKPDAGMGSSCPAQCSSCDDATNTCLIDCKANPGLCAKAITCPPGYNCDVECTTQNSCRTGVACPESGACTVDCTGQSSCQNVSCGNGPCDVSCTGGESCRTVGCNNSCACDVTCGANSRCETITCSDLECETFNNNGQQECSSTQNPLCNTCP